MYTSKLTAEVGSELRSLVADVLGIEPGAVSDDTGLATEPAWDSIAHLSIVTTVEQTYDVRFSMDEIRRIENFRDLASLLAERMNLRARA